MGDEAKPDVAADEAAAGASTTAKASVASPTPMSIATAALQSAREQVEKEGDGAAAESTTGKEKAGDEAVEAAAKTGDDPGQKQDETKVETDDEAPAMYTAAELKKVTNIFDLDPERMPKEIRPQLRAAKAKITEGFQSLHREQRERTGTRDTAKEETAGKSTDAAAAESVDLNALADELGVTPEGLQMLLTVTEQVVMKKFPEHAEKHSRDQQAAQQEQRDKQDERVTNALLTLSEPRDGRTAQFPELHPEDGDKVFHELVAKELEADKFLARIVATSNDVDVLAGAIEKAAHQAKAKQAKAAEPKPVASEVKPVKDAKGESRKEKEKANSDEQRGSKAATVGQKAATTDTGPMTVDRSLQEAKTRVANGYNAL